MQHSDPLFFVYVFVVHRHASQISSSRWRLSLSLGVIATGGYWIQSASQSAQKPITTVLSFSATAKYSQPFPNYSKRIEYVVCVINAQSLFCLQTLNFVTDRARFTLPNIFNLLWNGNKSLPAWSLCFIDRDMPFSAAAAELLPI